MQKNKQQAAQVVERLRSWIQRFIVGHNICPFAARPFHANLIAYEVSFATEEEQALFDLAASLRKLAFTGSSQVSNAFLIFPDWKSGFTSFMDFFHLANGLLEDMKLEGAFQLVLFHPDFRFSGEDPGNHSHYTNRSPFPLLHMLRTEELTEAIEAFGDTSRIYLRNIKYLNSLSWDELMDITQNNQG